MVQSQSQNGGDENANSVESKSKKGNRKASLDATALLSGNRVHKEYLGKRVKTPNTKDTFRVMEDSFSPLKLKKKT